jgi:hypothetical protein
LLFVLDEVIRPMTSRRLRRIKLTTLLVGAAGLGACVAPILTVPPPGAAEIGFSIYSGAAGDGGTVAGDGGTVAGDAGAAVGDAGTAASGGVKLWIAHGGPLPAAAGATYYLRDRALQSGVIATADADGSFTAQPLEGTERDPIQIYYVTPAGNYSESICVLLTDDSSPPPVCPE